jgi:hypothetical protein
LTPRHRYIEATARVVLYAYAYVFLEWLFFATKPSFMDAWTSSAKAGALLVGALPFVAAALALHALACLAALALSRTRRFAGRSDVVLRVVPALIATCIGLMLVDNFTYTVFGWGIVSTTAFTVPLYWVLCLGVFALHVRREPTRTRFKPALAACALLASAVPLAWSLQGVGHASAAGYRSQLPDGQLPNIILFGSDGVNAHHTSAYGYSRPTTPNLDRYIGRALVADNAFTNSGWTTGSLTSMMTGKYPATTKVLYPPHTLTGEDAYQHLPGILHALGYVSLQETVRYYADGPDLNWADSFDYANGRAVGRALQRSAGSSLALQAPLLLAGHVHERLWQRIAQLLFIERIVDQHAAVTSPEYAKVYGLSDENRMQRVFDFIRGAKKPFFVHVHLMGSHCCSYRPESRVFSGGLKEAERDGAAFDDTILESDRQFGRLMALLAERGLLENTLVVYSSDHATAWDFRPQVPLVFMFPKGAHAGHVTATTQLLDVAPTILDYLKVEIPAWMEGQSLLSGTFDRQRPIFSIYRMDRENFRTDKDDMLARVVHLGPPSYGLSQIGLVVCQRWYILRLDDDRMLSGDTATYRNKCPAASLPDAAEADAMMRDHLRDRGFRF